MKEESSSNLMSCLRPLILSKPSNNHWPLLPSLLLRRREREEKRSVLWWLLKDGFVRIRMAIRWKSLQILCLIPKEMKEETKHKNLDSPLSWPFLKDLMFNPKTVNPDPPKTRLFFLNFCMSRVLGSVLQVLGFKLSPTSSPHLTNGRRSRNKETEDRPLTVGDEWIGCMFLSPISLDLLSRSANEGLRGTGT